MLRKIVLIDEARCDGCGACVSSCHEGAIALVGGKARLVSEVYCDGLGACLGECPRGAIAVVEREAAGFDEAAVAAHLATRRRPGLSVVKDAPGPAAPPAPRQGGSTLSHWPVQLTLVPPHAPWLKGADLLVAADCVPFAYAAFHADFLAGRKLVVGCPKLDDNKAYAAKLAEVCGQAGLATITVVRMEVPCCGGLAWAAREGVARSGAAVTVRDVVVGVDGSIKQA